MKQKKERTEFTMKIKLSKKEKIAEVGESKEVEGSAYMNN